MVFLACDEDEKCHTAFPDLRQNFTAVLSKLDKSPAHASIRNPHTGVPTDIVVNKANFATALRTLLYVPSFDHLVPLVIRDEATVISRLLWPPPRKYRTAPTKI